MKWGRLLGFLLHGHLPEARCEWTGHVWRTMRARSRMLPNQNIVREPVVVCQRCGYPEWKSEQ